MCKMMSIQFKKNKTFYVLLFFLKSNVKSILRLTICPSVVQWHVFMNKLFQVITEKITICLKNLKKEKYRGRGRKTGQSNGTNKRAESSSKYGVCVLA